ncbi:hypothetical protein H5410_056491 [Solanum commersonii]|uniref:Uncharacterized protein n=1 Tax=Solanum commersonii TaxID=4109 RepID=A0A9J5WLV5_SOLCO|nr:hypothetical protein H5410_056491 [Solanum commersonii]
MSFKTLAMEPIGPNGQTDEFSWSNDLHSGFLGRPSRPYIWNRLDRKGKSTISKVKEAPDLVSWTSIKTLAMESIGPNGKISHFQVHGSFGDLDFRRHFCQKISWTSVKTFAMDSVGPDEKINPFSRFLMSFLLNFFVDVRQDVSYGADWSKRIFDVIFAKNFVDTVKSLAMEPVCPEVANRPIFKVNQARKLVNHLFCQFSCDIVHRSIGDPDFGRHFFQKNLWTSIKTFVVELVGPDVYGSFGDPNFRRHFCQNFSYTSVKTLTMELVGLDGQTGPFSWLNDLRIHGSFGDLDLRHHFCQKFSWMSIKTLGVELVGLDKKTYPLARSEEPRSG